MTPLQIGVVTACFAGFAYGLWTPLADALDHRLPSRSAVTALSDPEVTLDLQDGDVAVNPNMRSAVNGLPSAYIRLIREFGARIEATSLEALSHINVHEYKLTHVEGLYVPEDKVVYVAVDASDVLHTTLHEVGHLLDHALGRRSQQEQFQAVFREARQVHLNGAMWRGLDTEYFAEFFARYYFSERSRNWLEITVPAAATYFSELETAAMACAQLSCFKTSAGVSPR